MKARCEIVHPYFDGGQKVGEEIRLYANGVCVQTLHTTENFGQYVEGQEYDVAIPIAIPIVEAVETETPPKEEPHVPETETPPKEELHVPEEEHHARRRHR